ncbi:MAG TPA: L,D-transpeptidase, partial [Burkholderiales bacterium]|nr:L,D-transpeptidase [Burkholderiales bacterium]
AGAYAVALGRPDWKTPTGSYSVGALVKDKPWIVPPSIQEEMREQGRPVLTRVEPGPDNPLGRFWIGLTLPGYGIHGTNAPSSIYRMRTHGCIRVHPDDIEALYGNASLRMPVKIIYAHTVVARLADGRIVAEVNPDVYNRGGDPLRMMRDGAKAQGIEDRIDWTLAAQVARARMGQAYEIGYAPSRPQQ